MPSESEIKAILATWKVDLDPARRRLEEARLRGFRAAELARVRRAAGLAAPEVDASDLVLPEVVDTRSMRDALLLLAEWMLEGRITWARSIEEERRLTADLCRIGMRDLERLRVTAEDPHP